MYDVEAPCMFLHNPIKNIHLEIELGSMKFIQLESPNGIRYEGNVRYTTNDQNLLL